MAPHASYSMPTKAPSLDRRSRSNDDPRATTPSAARRKIIVPTLAFVAVLILGIVAGSEPPPQVAMMKASNQDRHQQQVEGILTTTLLLAENGQRRAAAKKKMSASAHKDMHHHHPAKNKNKKRRNHPPRHKKKDEHHQAKHAQPHTHKRTKQQHRGHPGIRTPSPPRHHHHKTKNKPRIVNGDDVATPKDYPFFTTPWHSHSFCGASLIAPDIVLSAAHCEDVFRRGKVLIGTYKADTQGFGSVVAEIVERIPHEHFVLNWDTIANDILLLHIEPPVYTIQPVKLNFDPRLPKDNEELVTIGLGQTSGRRRSLSAAKKKKVRHHDDDDWYNYDDDWYGDDYGYYDDDWYGDDYGGYYDDDWYGDDYYYDDDYDWGQPNVLQVATVFKTTDTECFDWRADVGRDITKTFLCAWDDEPHRESCFGDSGGPIMDLEGRVVGVVSFGDGDCSLRGGPVAYARVSAYKKWMQLHVCPRSINPPPELDCPPKTASPTSPAPTSLPPTTTPIPTRSPAASIASDMPNSTGVCVQDSSNRVCTPPLQIDYRGCLSTTVSGRPCARWDSELAEQRQYVSEKFPDAGLSGAYCRNPDHDSNGTWCLTNDPDAWWEYCNIPGCSPSLSPATTARPTVSPKPSLTGKPTGTLYPTQSPTVTLGPTEERACVSNSLCTPPWGTDYRGCLSQTRSGKPCLNWDQDDSWTPKNFPDAGLAENYCRNPDSDPLGVWCLVDDPFEWFERCNVHCNQSYHHPTSSPTSTGYPSSTTRPTPAPTYRGCDPKVTCRETYHGEEYRGCVSETSYGEPCLNWADSTWRPENYPNAGLNLNYCRNPDSDSSGLWCPTMDGYGYCNIPRCRESQRPTTSNNGVSTTVRQPSPRPTVRLEDRPAPWFSTPRPTPPLAVDPDDVSNDRVVVSESSSADPVEAAAAAASAERLNLILKVCLICVAAVSLLVFAWHVLPLCFQGGAGKD